MADPIKIAVTGASGHIAYSLLFRLLSGRIFGLDQPIDLRLVDIPNAMSNLEGVAMEIDDCGFVTLDRMNFFDDPAQGFDGVHWALLIGSKPRGPGQKRIDLIKENGPIFVGQGKALNNADTNVRVHVVGNPCNTNAMIAMRNSDVPNSRFSSLMRLDQNRATSLLAKTAGVKPDAVTNVTIWGNHSLTQYPDIENPSINGAPLTEAINDQDWLQNTFIKTIQNRGAAVIKARGASSAASAANAVLDDIISHVDGTAEGQWTSLGVCSNGEYGVDKDLVFGFPVAIAPGGERHIREDLTMSDWAKARFQANLDELRKEREMVRDLLPN